jgi:hypothetical protein
MTADSNAKSTLLLPLRMTLNKKVSQISQDGPQARKIALDILALANPATLSFFMLTLGEKLIEHGERLVALYPASAFSLSWVAIEVGKVYPQFMDVLFGLFFERSSYTIPSPINCPDPASVERQCGIVYLFGAVLVTPYPDGRLIEWGWIWLATLLNSAGEPPSGTSAILASFLEVAAWGMFQQWGRQFTKCLLYIQREMIPRLPRESVAGNTRLALLVQQLLEPGQCKMPEGAELIFCN